MLRALSPIGKITEPVDLEAFYNVPRRRRRGRPHVGICMITSLDGSTSLSGKSGDLGCETDRNVLRTLRQAADVIVVGASTVRAEGYRAPKKPGQKIGVVTLSCKLDFSSELFTSGSGFLITTTDAPEVPVPCIRFGTGTVDITKMIESLDADFVQLEGGPTLNSAFFSAGLVDELNITLAPKIVGGDGARISSSLNEAVSVWNIAHILEENGYLFTRYLRAENA